MIFTAKCWWLLRTQEQSAYYQLYHLSLCLFAKALVTVQFIRITKTLLIVPQKKLESIYEQFENRRDLQSVRQWVINTRFRIFKLCAGPVLCFSLLAQFKNVISRASRGVTVPSRPSWHSGHSPAAAFLPLSFSSRGGLKPTLPLVPANHLHINWYG